MELAQLRFLVVDDHFLLRQMVSTALKTHGVTAIDFASDGEDALSKTNQAQNDHKPYDILLLDWSMPKLNGYDLLRLLRGDKRHSKTAIVMLTAESEDKNIIKALEAGATAFITKPFQPDSLINKLDDVVKWRSEHVG